VWIYSQGKSGPLKNELERAGKVSLTAADAVTPNWCQSDAIVPNIVNAADFNLRPSCKMR
jgi:hypothetical protein